MSQPRAPAGQQANLRNPAAKVTCFFCHNKGHYANHYPKKTEAAPHPNGGRGQGNGHPQDHKANQKTQSLGNGRVNHISAEEAQEAPDVVLGMLLVNSQSATVLFDFGASHSFISKSFAALSDILYVSMHVPLIINSLGSEMRAEKECRDVSIEIRAVGFLANLILLNPASLDVILGMDWLSQHLG